MNWYAYKVLADTYDADRRAVAERHRLARSAARSDGPSDSVGRWSTAVSRLRTWLRPSHAAPVPSTGATIAGPCPELRPSLPR